MSLQAQCASHECLNIFPVADNQAGRVAPCPTCGTLSAIPLPVAIELQRQNTELKQQTNLAVHVRKYITGIQSSIAVCGAVFLLWMAVRAYSTLVAMPDQARDRWEYDIIAPNDITLTNTINQRGLDGWEIVSSRRAVTDGEAAYELILKRKK